MLWKGETRMRCGKTRQAKVKTTRSSKVPDLEKHPRAIALCCRRWHIEVVCEIWISVIAERNLKSDIIARVSGPWLVKVF